jgi:hypothetical protein
VNVCIERDKNRTVGHVGKGVIMRMYNEFLKPAPYPVDPNLPDAVICDLDGTLALLGDRSPYDASKCDELDTVNVPVQLAVSAIHSLSGARIIFMSGRKAKDREPTLRFIEEKATFRSFDLFMRDTADNRPDEVTKRELFDKHIRGQFNVVAMFDDRPSVVRLWKSMGLPVFDVGNGVEF